MTEGSISSADGGAGLTASPLWIRLLTPCIGDVLFIALLAVLTCSTLSVRLLGDAGIGWHIRAGQQIQGSHAIPRVDSFSAVMRGKTWFAWEWFYDLVVGVLDRWAGLNGVVWLTAVVIAGVFAWTFRLLLGGGTNLVLALALVLLAASASMVHFLARPHVVSWLFTLAWFWILDSSEHSMGQEYPKAGRRLWLLPVLMVVWVNVHGGFLVGFVLLAIYWAGAVWSEFRLKPEKFDQFLARRRWRARVKRLTAVGVAAGAATLVNPYGWKLHEHIFGYLSNRFLMEHIDEFQSPNFHGVAQKCFAVLVLATMVALAAEGRRLRVSEVLVILFALYSGLYATRNIPVSSLLLALVIGPLLTAAGRNLTAERVRARRMGDETGGFTARMTSLDLSLLGHLWPIAAVALTFWIAVHGGNLGSKRLMDAHFDAKRFPAAAVDFLGQRAPSGYAVTLPDYWGGYVIYRLYPRALVTVDDRHDLYGEEFLKLYLKMIYVEPGWDEFLRKYDVRCVLAPKGSALDNILELEPNWRRSYADDVAVIFERAEIR